MQVASACASPSKHRYKLGRVETRDPDIADVPAMQQQHLRADLRKYERKKWKLPYPDVGTRQAPVRLSLSGVFK